MATREGTWRYRDRFHESFGRTYFRRYGTGLASSIGIGTYLGDPTDAVDESYHEAIVTALENGCNVVDTAVNYRCQRSERVVGEALTDADVDRDEVVIATKGGFVPFDGARPADPGRYVREAFVDAGVVDADDLVAGSHSIAPGFVEHCLDLSLSNLDLETIDLYYVHNPETALERFDRETVYDRLEATFERLERRADDGDVGHYGVASWESFRVPRDHPKYLSLSEVVARASAAADTVGADATRFRAIQLPFNVAMADAFTVEAHDGADGETSALWFAQEAGIDVFTSASIAQGELTTGLPEAVAAKLSGDTPVQRAINFARSAPGVTASLVGASDPDHVAENLAAGEFDPLGADAFDAVFE